MKAVVTTTKDGLGKYETFFEHGEKRNYNKLQQWKNIEDEIEKRVVCSSMKPCRFYQVFTSDKFVRIGSFKLTAVVMRGNAFLLKTPEEALTYNIKTKKVYGGSGGISLLAELKRKENTKDILKSLGWDFLIQVPLISGFWNQTVIKGLFGGKITNNRDLLKVYFASSYRIKNIETTLLLKLLVDLEGSSHTVSTVKKALQVGVDRQNTFLNFFHFMGYPHATDLVGQAFLLS